MKNGQLTLGAHTGEWTYVGPLSIQMKPFGTKQDYITVGSFIVVCMWHGFSYDKEKHTLYHEKTVIHRISNEHYNGFKIHHEGIKKTTFIRRDFVHIITTGDGRVLFHEWS